jgi:ethanolaminephosphotransferase
MLKAEDAHFIRSYEYHGGDSSPFYKHVLSPLAQLCVDVFVPPFIAPNVITVFGLIITIVSTLVVFIFNPTLGPNAPRWLHIMVGTCILAYQTLDNMDGKQARKTRSSSALGMFVDHGCDAINAGVIILAMGSVLGTGWSERLFFTYYASFVPFYFQTWEEYYLGAMILPSFNGPSEGLFMSIVVAYLAAWKGTDFFHQVCST